MVRVRNLNGANVVVIGLGASGIAAARLARKAEAHVIATDVRDASQFGPSVFDLRNKSISLLFGALEQIDMLSADVVVVSPGVPRSEWLDEAERRGANLISELEFASWFVEAPMVAIGGTNGKSTTTELTGALLQTTHQPVFVGGNLGTPLSQAVVEEHPALTKQGFVVLEVSSFQLERIRGFHPHVSVLLNITPDHLDRYSSFEAYAYAKGGAFRMMQTNDVAIVPFGDDICTRIASLGYARQERIDGPSPAINGVENHCFIDRKTGVSIPCSQILLQGRHNLTNLCAAWAAAENMIGHTTNFVDVITSFKGLAHRCVCIDEHNGVTFYDDSKGTNVGAAVQALRGLPEERVVLIAGGRDKGGSYEPLIDALEKKGRALVVIGEAAETIMGAARLRIPMHFSIEKASNMRQAVAMAASLAHAGDAVLLSPACSSFDMFRDYKHRGDEFVAAVQALKRSP